MLDKPIGLTFFPVGFKLTTRMCLLMDLGTVSFNFKDELALGAGDDEVFFIFLLENLLNSVLHSKFKAITFLYIS